MKKIPQLGLLLLLALCLVAQDKLPTHKSGIAERWISAWNSHDPDKLAAIFTPDVMYEDVPFGAVNHGSAELRKFAASEFEGQAVWRLAQVLPRETPVVIANSMPVRDAEYFWGASDRALNPVFNRGANGIDGTLSTALGVAHGGRPTVLLTGDLALLHDTNGFLHRPHFRGSLTIVLINNAGGGIFEHLPVAQFDPPFEKFFATPQEVDFLKLTAAYGVEYQLIRDWSHFTDLVAVLPAQGIRVLEIKTNRKRDAAFRKKIFVEMAAEVARALRV